MPPNRRKKSKKRQPIGTNGVADDDVFEVNDKPTTKRYKAANAKRQNLRSGDKPSTSDTIDKKHVGRMRINPFNSQVKRKPTATIVSDSDQVSRRSYF